MCTRCACTVNPSRPVLTVCQGIYNALFPAWLLSCQHPEEGGTKPSVLGLQGTPGGTWTCLGPRAPSPAMWASQPLLFQYHLMKLIRYFAPLGCTAFSLNWYIDLYSFLETSISKQALERGEEEILLQWQFLVKTHGRNAKSQVSLEVKYNFSQIL